MIVLMAGCNGETRGMEHVFITGEEHNQSHDVVVRDTWCQVMTLLITFHLPLLLYTIHGPSTIVVQSVRMPSHNMSRACPRK